MNTDLKTGDIVWYFPNILYQKDVDYNNIKIVQGKVWEVEDIDSFVVIYVSDNEGNNIQIYLPEIVFKSEDEAKNFINKKIKNKEI